MIFNESLDRALWLMLISDKNNRDKIVGFINDVPSLVFDRIKLILSEYYEYENNDVSLLCMEDICLREEIDVLECKYLINLDRGCHSLSILKFNYLKNECSRLVVYFNNIELFGQQRLGSFYYDGSDDIVDVSYDLVDTLLGKMVAYSDDVMYKKYKLVFMGDIPKDVKIDDFWDTKRLVRKK